MALEVDQGVQGPSRCPGGSTTPSGWPGGSMALDVDQGVQGPSG